MTVKDFITILDILKDSLPKNSPSNILKNSFERTPYTILIATLLSLRTKDENTAKVCKELFLKANTPQELIRIQTEELEKIIRPTGMYRKKAQIIIEVSKVLISKFNAIVPNTREELISIKGVGAKTANIVLNNAFSIPTIAVDTHVHRISNLLGFIDTKNEKESEKELCHKVPKEYWSDLNFNIVTFGQTICLPKNPKCDICPIRKYCNNFKFNLVL